KVFRSSNADPKDIEMVRKVLKEHEQALVEANCILKCYCINFALKHRNPFKADVPVWKRGGNGYAPETPPKSFQAWGIYNPNDDVKMWYVGGDAFDSMEDVGCLEFADLSLDEPEFENDLIIDN
nr:hAT dimerization domain, ribonuclease H-like domain protein [Tanacetum cinerariifolium]